MPNIAATLSLNVPAITALCKGEPGNTVLNGVGSPSPSQGVDGDFFIDTSVYAIYGPKSGGVWGSGFVLTNSTSAPIWTSTSSTMSANSGAWASVYSFVNSNSSRYQTTVSTVSSLSSRWQSNYTTTNTYSAGWWTTWNTVSSLSSTWGAATAGVTQIVAGTNVTISPPGGTGVVTINAAGGGGGGNGADTEVRALTARFQSTTSTVSATSGRWETSYTQVRTLSSQWNWSYNNSLTGTDNWNTAYSNFLTIASDIPGWNSTHDTLYAVSGGFVSTSSTVRSGSADWWNTTQTVLDPVTGLFLSARNFYNITYVTLLSDTQVVQDPALGGPGTISRVELYDAIAVQFTNNFPYWNATTQSLIFEPIGKPILALGSAEIPSITNAGIYVLGLSAHKRTITTDTATRTAIRINTNDTYGTPYGIGTEFNVLQQGTGIIEVSAVSPQVINSNPRTNRYTRGGVTLWSTSGPYTMFKILKVSSTDWVVLSSEL